MFDKSENFSEATLTNELDSLVSLSQSLHHQFKLLSEVLDQTYRQIVRYFPSRLSLAKDGQRDEICLILNKKVYLYSQKSFHFFFSFRYDKYKRYRQM